MVRHQETPWRAKLVAGLLLLWFHNQTRNVYTYELWVWNHHELLPGLKVVPVWMLVTILTFKVIWFTFPFSNICSHVKCAFKNSHWCGAQSANYRLQYISQSAPHSRTPAAPSFPYDGSELGTKLLSVNRSKMWDVLTFSRREWNTRPSSKVDQECSFRHFIEPVSEIVIQKLALLNNLLP